MPSLALPIATTIRECAATILTFAFSRRSMEKWADRTLQGEFSQFRHTMFEIPTHRAERACLELAILVRYLDDLRGLSDAYRGQSAIDFGRLHTQDGKVTPLD